MSGTVGFTNDGKVFLTSITVLPEGKQAQVTFYWTPQEADQIAGWLRKAADGAQEKTRIIIPKGNFG